LQAPRPGDRSGGNRLWSQARLCGAGLTIRGRRFFQDPGNLRTIDTIGVQQPVSHLFDGAAVAFEQFTAGGGSFLKFGIDALPDFAECDKRVCISSWSEIDKR
jgi:hypothetical protein